MGRKVIMYELRKGESVPTQREDALKIYLQEIVEAADHGAEHTVRMLMNAITHRDFSDENLVFDVRECMFPELTKNMIMFEAKARTSSALQQRICFREPESTTEEEDVNTDLQIRYVNDDIQSAMDVGKPEAIPAILQKLRHADFRDDEDIVFDLRRLGTSAEAARELILGEISLPEFGTMRDRARFIVD